VSELAAIFGPGAVEALERLIDERVEAALTTSGGATGTEWLSVEGAATFLGCSPNRVRKLAAAGKLAYSQEGPGARVFFSTADLNEAMRRWRFEARR
jgi:hypothetical protein